MAMIRRGDMLARLGRFEEADVNYETVALTGKLDFVSTPRVLTVRKLIGKWELSGALRKVMESSADIPSMIGFADFLIDAGDRGGANRIAAKIASNPNGTSLLVVKARARALGGDMEGAIRLLTSAGIETRETSAVRLEGELWEAKGDIANAALAYEREISKSPGDVSLMTALARVQEKMGRHRAAIHSADSANGSDSREWEPHKVKADAYASLGESDKARSELAHVQALLALAGLRLEDLKEKVAS